MTSTFNSTTTFEVIQCCKCGIAFGLPADFIARRRTVGGDFYCPSGHPQAFVVTENQRLKNELARNQARLDQANAEADHQRRRREAAERSQSAMRGQVTKIKNRVKKGVCPCCNRYFANLHQHMTNQHPEFQPAAEA